MKPSALAKKDYNYLCGLDDSDHVDEGTEKRNVDCSPAPVQHQAESNREELASPIIMSTLNERNFMVGLLYFFNQRPGIFVAPYLLLEGVSESKIGFVLFISGIIALSLQTPAGQIVDEVHDKTKILIMGNIVTILGCLLLSNFSMVSIVTMAVTFNVVSDVFVFPSLYATTLGIFGSEDIEKQAPLNETFMHSGNATFAVTACVIVLFAAGQASSIFYICVAMRCMGICIILRYINSYNIDFNKSRGLVSTMSNTDVESSTHSKDTFASIFLIEPDVPLSYKVLLTDFHVVVFLVSIMLFHLANAAMLPLLSQQLYINNAEKGFAFAAAAVITAQVSMVCSATLSGRLVPKIGTKPLFLMGLAAIPIRGVLIVLLLQAEDRGIFTNASLLCTQVLDGLAGGIVGVLLVLITENLARGSGRFAMLLGMGKTAEGMGAAFSNLIGETLAEYWGYSGSFLFLSAISLFPFIIYSVFMPTAIPDESQVRVHDNLSVASRHGVQTNAVDSSSKSVDVKEIHLNKSVLSGAKRRS